MSNVHPLPVKVRESDAFDAPSPPPYAEFAVSTNFSFLRAASHPEELVEQAKALGLCAIGIADRNSVAGVVRAHVVAKEKGLRLAVGTRLVFADGTPDILAYPSDRAAWGRLTRLLSAGKLKAEKGRLHPAPSGSDRADRRSQSRRHAAGTDRRPKAVASAFPIKTTFLEPPDLACNQLSLPGRRSAADGKACPHRGRQFHSPPRQQ
jgi:hypothetical protein